MSRYPATEDFFRLRLDQMIDLRYPLVVLALRLPWRQLEASVAPLLARKSRAATALPQPDLFGDTVQRSARASAAGRPRLPLRLMISLLYLKHACNESDEGVVERWRESPRWQYFSGETYYEDRLPCDASTLVKFRQWLGEEGLEALLAQTIKLAVELKLIERSALELLIVDTTLQAKAIAHPTGRGLLETARTKLVQAAQEVGIRLKQTFVKEGQQLLRHASRYAHARQFRRMRRAIRRQGTIVARLAREIGRKAAGLSETVRQRLDEAREKATRLVAQSRKQQAEGQGKLYAWHAPEVDCINKGKARQPYEFGVKVSLAATAEHNLVVGVRAFHGNPYDGHALAEQVEQSTILMQEIGTQPVKAYVDRAYRGVEADNPRVRIVHPGKMKQFSAEERQGLKRRQAIEPIIGHLKADHRMNHCHLKGEMGDRLHALLCAAGYNPVWLLRMIVKKGLAFLRAWLLHLAILLRACCSGYSLVLPRSILPRSSAFSVR